MQSFKFQNLFKNIPMLISAFAFLVLNLTYKEDILFVGIVGIAVLFIAAKQKYSFSFIKENSTPACVITAFCTSAFYIMYYYRNMYNKKIYAAIGRLLGINNRLVVIVFSVALSIAALYFLTILTCLVFSKLKLTYNSNQTSLVNKKADLTGLLVCFLSAACAITICSKSSPIYPFNDWVDSNCFFTVGKSVLDGVVPYRDLLEQKGPVLYFIHTLASLISYTDFFGVYLLEIIAATFFLFISLKILKIYKPDINLVWIPIIAAAVYSSHNLHHGDSAEEFCLPLMIYSVYCAVKSLHFKKEISFIEGFFIGITSACILWIKFTLLGFYIGWFIAFVIIKIKEKKVSSIFKLVGSVVSGIVVLSIPILIYFAYNKALGDLFTVYFYNNLFLYSSGESSSTAISVIINLAKGFASFTSHNILVFSCIAAGIVGLLSAKRKNQALLVISCALTLFVFVFLGGRIYRYYSFIFSIFVPLGIVVFSDFINRFTGDILNKNIKTTACVAVVALALAFSFIQCGNTYLLKYDKEDLPQYKFAEIINKEENPTLLNYGFLDGGFYTVTGIVPDCKYFCKLNIELEEMDKGQKKVIDEGLVDFVVTRRKKLDSENYKCVSQADFFFEEDQTYYLYKLVEE